MTSVFHSLASADLWMGGVESEGQRLATAFGLEYRADALRSYADYGIQWIFLPHPGASDSATELELIGPDPGARPDRSRADYPWMLEFGAEQSGRPMGFHATVVRTLDLAELRSRLDSAGAAYRWDAPTESIRRPRLFLGWRDGRYDPAVDAGLHLEFWEPYEPPQSVGVVPHERPRIESRALIVDDLDEAVLALRRSIGWEPERIWTIPGARFAEFGFDSPASARLQLIAPAAEDEDLAASLRAWGPGAHTIRFAEPDLTTRATALVSAGIGIDLGEASDGSGRRAILADVSPGLPGRFEFVEP